MVACFCLACPLASPPVDSATGPTSTGEAETTTVTETANPTTSGTTESPPETSGTTAESLCGNGVMDFAEPCDDGNSVNADGCNNDCRPSGSMLWEFRSGIFVIDNFNDVAVTEDGSIFAGGRWLNEGRWLTRFNEQGEGLWSRTYDPRQSAGIHALGVEGDAIYATGAVFHTGEQDVVTGRFDLDGALVWQDQFDSGFGDDYATGLSITPEGDVVIAGVATLQDGLAELWTRRHGSDGTVQWTEGHPLDLATLFSIGPGVVAAGDEIVVGYAHALAPDTFEELLVAYAPGGGAPLWTRAMPMTDGVLRGVARAPGGDILTTGEVTVLRRLTGAGEPIWAASDCADAHGFDVAVDSQGDVIVVGSDSGDVRICKFTAEGALRWDREIDGGVGIDIGKGVALMPDDRIIVAGQVENGQVPDAWLAMFTP